MESLIVSLGASFIALLIIGIIITFIPFYIAIKRDHQYKLVIFILCLFSVSGVAWLVALVWSLWPQDSAIKDPITKDATGIQKHPVFEGAYGEPINIEPFGFNGERLLSNDAYKIYLSKAYQIHRDDVFGKFICKDRLFDEINNALVFAAADDLKNAKDAKLREVERLAEKKKNRQLEEEEIQRLQQSRLEEESKIKARNQLILICVLISLLLVGGVFYGYKKYQDQKSGEICVQEIDRSKVIVLGKIQAYFDKFPELPSSQRTKITQLLDANASQIESSKLPSSKRSFLYGYEDELDLIDGASYSLKGVPGREAPLTIEQAAINLKSLISLVTQKDEAIKKYRQDSSNGNSKAVANFLKECKDED